MHNMHKRFGARRVARIDLTIKSLQSSKASKAWNRDCVVPKGKTVTRRTIGRENGEVKPCWRGQALQRIRQWP